MTHINTAGERLANGARILVIGQTVNHATAAIVKIKADAARHTYGKKPNGRIVGITMKQADAYMRGRTFDVVVCAPKLVLMHPGLAAAISWATATSDEATILLMNSEEA